MTTEQLGKIKSKQRSKPGMTEEEKWFEIYWTLFPGASLDPVLSPCRIWLHLYLFRFNWLMHLQTMSMAAIGPLRQRRRAATAVLSLFMTSRNFSGPGCPSI